MKYQEAKKRLWMESAIVAAILAALGGLIYYLGSVYEESARNNQVLENQISAIVMTSNTLRDKFTRVQQNADLYQEVLRKNANNSLSIDRDKIRDKFEQFKSRYFLNNLRVTIDPQQEMSGPQYKRETQMIVAMGITASFYAITDEDAYALVQAIAQELPGSAKVVRFVVTRQSTLADEHLLTISRTGQYPLVNSEVRFLWLGLQPAEAANANNNGVGANAPTVAP